MLLLIVSILGTIALWEQSGDEGAPDLVIRSDGAQQLVGRRSRCCRGRRPNNGEKLSSTSCKIRQLGRTTSSSRQVHVGVVYVDSTRTSTTMVQGMKRSRTVRFDRSVSAIRKGTESWDRLLSQWG
jgi:hypothetical protein